MRLVARLVEQLALVDLVIRAAQQFQHRGYRVPHDNGSHHLGTVARVVRHRISQFVLAVLFRIHKTDHGDFAGEIAVESVQRSGTGIDEFVTGFHRQFCSACENDHRAGGVPNDDTPCHGVGPVPAAVAGGIGNDVFAHPLHINRVADVQPRGDVADRRVVHHRPGIDVLSSSLDQHLALSDEHDGGSGRVLYLHHPDGGL